MNLSSLSGSDTNSSDSFIIKARYTRREYEVVFISSKMMIRHICCGMWMICRFLQEIRHIFRSLKL